MATVEVPHHQTLTGYPYEYFWGGAAPGPGCGGVGANSIHFGFSLVT